jgi:hypothetical protein
METKQEPIFPKGMSFFLPHEKAPSFIKGKISIDPKAFVAFMNENREHMSEKGFMSFDLKESTKGTWYLALDTFKKN